MSKPKQPVLTPLCYVCNKRRATSSVTMTCWACAAFLRENGGRLPGPIIQPGYTPPGVAAPDPPKQAWLPSGDEEG